MNSADLFSGMNSEMVTAAHAMKGLAAVIEMARITE